MKSVAEHAALLLGPELGSDVHFTLSYVESEEKQVTATTSSKHFPTGRVVSNIWWPQNYSIVYALTILMYYLMVRKPGIRRDGHLLFEVEMYLQKGCIMVSGVGSS